MLPWAHTSSAIWAVCDSDLLVMIRKTERDRYTDRQTDRNRDRQTETDANRQT